MIDHKKKKIELRGNTETNFILPNKFLISSLRFPLENMLALFFFFKIAE